MLGKFFNSLYYGKAGKGDYTPENLPKNRIQLFFEVLRVRWTKLIQLNLLYVLFWLPALLWTGWNYLALEGVLGAFMEGQITQEVMSGQLQGLMMTWLLVLWPCIAITGPATAGVAYVTRNWARDQHSFMLSDFKDAVKENWKQALVISTITGLMPLVVYICYRFYGSMAAQNGILFVVPQVLVVVVAVMWLLMLQLIYALMVTYQLSFSNLLRNAAILSIGKLPLSVGIRLAGCAVLLVAGLLIWFVPSIAFWTMMVLVFYYLIFGFAFSRLVYASYANALMEQYINPRIEGAPVNMGLRQYTEDDYEIDPTLPQPPPQEDTLREK